MGTLTHCTDHYGGKIIFGESLGAIRMRGGKVELKGFMVTMIILKMTNIVQMAMVLAPQIILMTVKLFEDLLD